VVDEVAKEVSLVPEISEIPDNLAFLGEIPHGFLHDLGDFFRHPRFFGVFQYGREERHFPSVASGKIRGIFPKNRSEGRFVAEGGYAFVLGDIRLEDAEIPMGVARNDRPNFRSVRSFGNIGLLRVFPKASSAFPVLEEYAEACDEVQGILKSDVFPSVPKVFRIGKHGRSHDARKKYEVVDGRGALHVSIRFPYGPYCRAVFRKNGIGRFCEAFPDLRMAFPEFLVKPLFLEMFHFARYVFAIIRPVLEGGAVLIGRNALSKFSGKAFFRIGGEEVLHFHETAQYGNCLNLNKKNAKSIRSRIDSRKPRATIPRYP
jgi:hypothetical protein